MNNKKIDNNVKVVGWTVLFNGELFGPFKTEDEIKDFLVCNNITDGESVEIFELHPSVYVVKFKPTLIKV